MECCIMMLAVLAFGVTLAAKWALIISLMRVLVPHATLPRKAFAAVDARIQLTRIRTYRSRRAASTLKQSCNNYCRNPRRLPALLAADADVSDNVEAIEGVAGNF